MRYVKGGMPIFFMEEVGSCVQVEGWRGGKAAEPMDIDVAR